MKFDGNPFGGSQFVHGAVLSANKVKLKETY
jgi:hypothetical protein